MHRSNFFILLAVVCTVVAPQAAAKDSWNNVERIIAIGDLHGDLEQYENVLLTAGVTDRKGNWAAGRTHVVQLGDIPDRGADSLAIIQSVQKLQRQAKRAGGYLHPLIGNHEAMNIYGDLRYVHPGEYQVLVNKKSKRYQNDYFRDFINHLRASQPDLEVDENYRKQWEQQFPLGYVEHRTIWQPGGEVAEWARKNNTVIRINDVLFVHGGLNPHEEPRSIRDINRTITRELAQYPLPANTLAENEQGPLWYRGHAQHSAAKESAPLSAMLDYYKANHIVVGHTPTRGFIHPRFDKKAIMADVGISKHYGAGNAVLLIEANQMFALHRGVKLPLPNDDGLIAYLETVAELEPNPVAVMKVVSLLRKAAAEAEKVKATGMVQPSAQPAR